MPHKKRKQELSCGEITEEKNRRNARRRMLYQQKKTKQVQPPATHVDLEIVADGHTLISTGVLNLQTEPSAYVTASTEILGNVPPDQAAEESKRERNARRRILYHEKKKEGDSKTNSIIAEAQEIRTTRNTRRRNLRHQKKNKEMSLIPDHIEDHIGINKDIAAITLSNNESTLEAEQASIMDIDSNKSYAKPFTLANTSEGGPENDLRNKAVEVNAKKRKATLRKLHSQKKNKEISLLGTNIESEITVDKDSGTDLYTNPVVNMEARLTSSMNIRQSYLFPGKPMSKLQNLSHREAKTSSAGPEGVLHDVTIGKVFGNLMSALKVVNRTVPETPYKMPDISNCRFCGAKKFCYETANFCCNGGQISLYHITIPDRLEKLYSGVGASSIHFLQYIKAYNDIFSFTSMGVHLDPIYATRNNGIYTFRAQGQIYHFIDELYPSGSMPTHLQLYFYDTEQEIFNRRGVRDKLQPCIISELIDILAENPYSRFFRSLSDVDNIDNYQIMLKSDPQIGSGNNLPPTVSQVAALWIENDEASESRERNIIVKTHQDEPQTISHYYGCYDPLQYPLIYPLGEPGWHRGIKKLSPKKRATSCQGQGKVLAAHSTTSEDLLEQEKAVGEGYGHKQNMVTAREYYAYRLQIRPNVDSILLESGRLLQQFVVDMYVKIETSRLDYFRNNQAEIRADLYKGIVDSVHQGESDASKIGTRIVLPATFIGGPRNVRKRYLDAITLVRRYGKPDLFLTMTCNPNWNEIQAELKTHEEAQNRPDLITRVFRSKFEHLEKEVIKNQLFGQVAAYTFVVEFQKRGMPHVHMLIILKKRYKLDTIDRINQFICAELPDPQKTPHLYATVVRHMMHGPCGTLNADNVCMKKNKCKNKYPRNFADETEVETDGYPIYRRRDTGRIAHVRGHMLDNRWVVPYNAYLLAMFDCHINVEVCASIKAIKYLYKYIYKGHDRIIYRVAASSPADKLNEIQQFLTARWISPPEATWRIFRFPLYELQPPVITLQLHLEGYQRISFNKATNLQDIASNEFLTRTTLTQFLWMNSHSPMAKELNLLYEQFPEHFVWSSQRLWTERKKQKVIGRLATANPIEGERYYLRLLLTNIRAPTSYASMRSVQGVTYDSFREAALARHLLDDDDSHVKCMEEASTYQMPISLRLFFCTILTHCSPQRPQELFFRFETHMEEDYVGIQKINKQEARQILLRTIQSKLQTMGKGLEDFQLDHLLTSPRGNQTCCKEVENELNVHISEEDLMASSLLNPEQRLAYDQILDAIFSKKPRSFFIDGPGGTGKTFLYRALLAKVRSQQRIALATASSGVAASILPNGRTAHNRFKIPIENEGILCCNVKKKTGMAEAIIQASLIIWDEAPMAKKTSIEALDHLLQDLMETPVLFGNKVVVFGGDFRQVLPVIPGGTRQDCVSASLVQSYVWPLLHKIKLKLNMRARNDTAFSDYILRIGDGLEEEDENGNIKVPTSLVLQPNAYTSPLDQMIQAVFTAPDSIGMDTHCFSDSAILTPKNLAVDQINETMLSKLPGQEHIYLSFDQTKDQTQQGLYIDLLHTLSPPGMPLHHLVLKENCPIMLLRNINPPEGLCNGTRLLCKGFKDHMIMAQITSGDRIGSTVYLPRISFEPNNPHHYPVLFERRQFPVRICFAMTINKAQGQTLRNVGIYLPEPVFSHGQLYVALSRGTTAKGIRIYIKHSESDPQKYCYTKNIVYKEVLQLANAW